MENNKDIIQGVREILNSGTSTYQNLISILQAIQNRFRYIPGEAMIEVSRHLGMSPANVFGVATFYNQFRFSPPGKRHIRVCMGTACHIKQGDKVLDQWKRRLEIDEGERTPDGEYSLERVACVGCCAMAPVTIIEDEVIGHMAPTKVDGILLQDKIEKEKAGQVEPGKSEDEKTTEKD